MKRLAGRKSEILLYNHTPFFQRKEHNGLARYRQTEDAEQPFFTPSGMPPQNMEEKQNLRKIPVFRNCSPTWFGSTEPEIANDSGEYTGRIITTYNDAELKDPCVKDCVVQHEAVHRRQMEPKIREIMACDKAAGNDARKQEKCNELNNELSSDKIKGEWECEAYRKSFTCLTLKILDSSSACSKSPHKEIIKKHRAYEACELKNYCNQAGTPERGIPNA